MTEEKGHARSVSATGPPPQDDRGSPAFRFRVLWFSLAITVLLVVALAIGTPVVDGDTARDLGGELLRAPTLVGHPDWRLIPALLGLTAVHYLLAAVALRAAAGPGCRPPLGESTLVQLVATVANRVTPNGLGGAAVNSRYLTRRGLAAAEAVGSVAGLSLFGGLADVFALAFLLLAGAGLGLRGVGDQFRPLDAGLQWVTSLSGSAAWQIAALAAGTGALTWVTLRCARGTGRTVRVLAAVGRAARHTAGLLRRPRDLAVLVVSSACTTVVLAVALSLSVAAVAGGSPGHLGGLLVGYVIGAAVGGAVPLPAGVGSTEAAMVGTVMLAHVSSGHAISAVLLFRAVTFWSPVPLGLLAAPRLRRTGAL